MSKDSNDRTPQHSTIFLNESLLSVLNLEEVNLEELLEVEVSDFSLVVHSEELGKCCVREDSASEGWVEAAVALDILGDELGHIGL